MAVTQMKLWKYTIHDIKGFTPAMDFMLLISKDLKSCLRFSFSVIAQLDWAIQGKELDYPVKPDNDNHWNRVSL
jgi:hypothetical protein